jgi:hypothetical protein
MTIRERAWKHVGAAHRPRQMLDPPAHAHGVDAMMWNLVVGSLERLKRAHADGEHDLFDAYVDAHLRILEAIAERAR